jgi:phage terminase large subunit GpA-like protein
MMAKEGPDAATFECENCRGRIAYESLRWMDANGGWACPLGLDRSQQSLTPEGEPAVESQHIWAAYSYHAGAVWRRLVEEYREALEAMRRGDPDVMQTFHNTVLGIPWEDSIASKLTGQGLAQRRENREQGNGYEIGTVPIGVLMITVGVDVQGGGGTMDERLVVTIWGWGRGEEGWHLGHFELDGDPQQIETLNQLDNVDATEWIREDGAVLKMSLGAIDEGGLSTHEIRSWCGSRTARWVPVRGAPQKGKALVGKGVPVNINRKNQLVQKKGVLMYPVGYEVSVNRLQGQLRCETPGPGYLHLGQAATDQFLDELFPWRRMPNREKTAYSWVLPTGARDEGGDCTRYAYAALQLVARRYDRATMWDQLERQLEAQRDQGAAPAGLSLAGWRR